jgi:hypothetical protein
VVHVLCDLRVDEDLEGCGSVGQPEGHHLELNCPWIARNAVKSSLLGSVRIWWEELSDVNFGEHFCLSQLP